MSRVFLGGAVDIDLAAIRQRQTDIDLVESASAVVRAWRFQGHAAGGHAAISLFELVHMVCNRGTNILPRIHPLEVDLDRCLHDVTSPKKRKQHGGRVAERIDAPQHVVKVPHLRNKKRKPVIESHG